MKMKKFLAVALSVTMLLGMNASAYADTQDIVGSETEFTLTVPEWGYEIKYGRTSRNLEYLNCDYQDVDVSQALVCENPGLATSIIVYPQYTDLVNSDGTSTIPMKLYQKKSEKYLFIDKDGRFEDGNGLELVYSDVLGNVSKRYFDLGVIIDDWSSAKHGETYTAKITYWIHVEDSTEE